MHHDVVARAEGIVIVRGERLAVGLDQALIAAFEVLQRGADGIAVGGLRLLDRHRDEMHRVIGVRGSDRREDIARAP